MKEKKIRGCEKRTGEWGRTTRKIPSVKSSARPPGPGRGKKKKSRKPAAGKPKIITGKNTLNLEGKKKKMKKKKSTRPFGGRTVEEKGLVF